MAFWLILFVSFTLLGIEFNNAKLNFMYVCVYLFVVVKKASDRHDGQKVPPSVLLSLNMDM